MRVMILKQEKVRISPLTNDALSLLAKTTPPSVGAPMKGYTIGNDNTRISKPGAREQKWAWPFYLPKDDPIADRSALKKFPRKIPFRDPSSGFLIYRI